MRVGFYETKDRTNPMSQGVHGQISYDVYFDDATGKCTITMSTTASYADGTIEKIREVYSGELTRDEQ